MPLGPITDQLSRQLDEVGRQVDRPLFKPVLFLVLFATSHTESSGKQSSTFSEQISPGLHPEPAMAVESVLNGSWAAEGSLASSSPCQNQLPAFPGRFLDVLDRVGRNQSILHCNVEAGEDRFNCRTRGRSRPGRLDE